MQTPLGRLALCFSLLLISACGDEEGAGSPLPPGGGYLETADSAAIGLYAGRILSFATEVARHTVQNGGRVPFPQAVGLPWAQTSAPILADDEPGLAVCTPIETGVDDQGFSIDADGDMVADDYKLDYGSSCVTETAAARTTRSGFTRIRDTNVPGAIMSVERTENLRTVVDSLVAGGSRIRTYVRTETIVLQGGLGTLTLEYIATDTVITPTGSRSGYAYRNSVTASFDPDEGHALSYDPQATVLVPGDFTFTADYRFEEGRTGAAFPGKYRLVVSTPDPLHYSPACGTHFTSGQFRGLLNGNADVGFSTTFTACGVSTYDVFGATP